jgi:hypothetical protein
VKFLKFQISETTEITGAHVSNELSHWVVNDYQSELEREFSLIFTHASIDGRITRVQQCCGYTLSTFRHVINSYLNPAASLGSWISHALLLRSPAPYLHTTESKAKLPFSWRLQCSSFPIIYDLKMSNRCLF